MNEEHVRLIREGQLEGWRSDNPGVELDLSGADLRKVDLRGADLNGANMVEANLSGNDLRTTNMFNVRLNGADLSRVDMGGGMLMASVLYGANLKAADLSGARLQVAGLDEADLSEANLTGANLQGSRLVKTNLDGATLTGVRLFGTARDNWSIVGVVCDYVFWGLAGTPRIPENRDLEPGEFERLYAQLPTIEYVFENGMAPLDPAIMDRIVLAINQRNPEFELQIDSIQARGIRPTIKFNVRFEEQKTAASAAISQDFDEAKARLQGHDEILNALGVLAGLQSGRSISVTGDYNTIATEGSTINIQECAGHLEEIQKAIEEAPEGTLTDDVRREALDAVSKGFRDIAAGKLKEAVERLSNLGLDVVTRSHGYEVLRELAEKAF